MTASGLLLLLEKDSVFEEIFLLHDLKRLEIVFSSRSSDRDDFANELDALRC